jgi:septum formation protein
MRLILASASPARLAVLRAAGIEPEVEVSGVDEDAITTGLADAPPEELVLALARAKARAVAGNRSDETVVVGCDSMLCAETPEGTRTVGKPPDADTARRRWGSMAGTTGTLSTGHCVLRLVGGAISGEAADTKSTLVRFGTPSDAELDAYLASGEPLAVAGGFTLDGLGGWFVEGVDGDPSAVIGISLPLTRALLGMVGVAVTDLWRISR